MRSLGNELTSLGNSRGFEPFVYVDNISWRFRIRRVMQPGPFYSNPLCLGGGARHVKSKWSCFPHVPQTVIFHPFWQSQNQPSCRIWSWKERWSYVPFFNRI